MTMKRITDLSERITVFFCLPHGEKLEITQTIFCENMRCESYCNVDETYFTMSVEGFGRCAKSYWIRIILIINIFYFVKLIKNLNKQLIVFNTEAET